MVTELAIKPAPLRTQEHHGTWRREERRGEEEGGEEMERSAEENIGHVGRWR